MIDRGKRGKTLSEVKPVENINKNLQLLKTLQNSQEKAMLESLFRLMPVTLLKKENPAQKSAYFLRKTSFMKIFLNSSYISKHL